MDDSPHQKIREPSSFVDNLNWKILYLGPLCQTLSTAFSTSGKDTIKSSPLLTFSVTVWDRRKRWSFADLAFLKPDWYLLRKSVSSRCFRRRFSITHLKSFMMVPSKVMGWWRCISYVIWRLFLDQSNFADVQAQTEQTEKCKVSLV